MEKILIPYSIYLLSLLLPSLAGVIGFRRTNRDMKLLLVLFLTTLIVETMSLIVALNGYSNNWIQDIFLPIEYTFFALLFRMWQTGKMQKKLISYSIPVFILADLATLILLKNMDEMNSFAISLSCVFYVSMASYTLFTLEARDTGTMYKDYRFWICSGLLLYAAGSLSFYVFTRMIVVYAVYYVHLGVNMAANILYMTGFLYHIRSKSIARPSLSG